MATALSSPNGRLSAAALRTLRYRLMLGGDYAKSGQIEFGGMRPISSGIELGGTLSAPFS